MRVALKVAYDGRAFFGHQRQPEARTVEGECLRALSAAKILADPRQAFFRSASRTDRGVSAVGNVIAFNTSLRPDAVVGAFNDKARGVWAWAFADVPESFHPRHALERWYRYHLLEPVAHGALEAAASCFVGEHDFRWFTSDPPGHPLVVNAVDVTIEGDAALIDVRARSFRRGMIRRIVAAMLVHARGDVSIEEIQSALRGQRRDFGTVPAEPLLLQDVRYDFEFQILRKPKVLAEWARMDRDVRLKRYFVNAVHRAVQDRAPIEPRSVAPQAETTDSP